MIYTPAKQPTCSKDYLLNDCQENIDIKITQQQSKQIFKQVSNPFYLFCRCCPTHQFLVVTCFAISATKLLGISYQDYISVMQAYQSRPINDNYCIVDTHMLGKGSTGNVYLGFQRNNFNHRVAIKAIDLRSIDNEVTKYLLSCEIAALSNLGKLANTGHENIVKLHDIALQDHFIYLVMEHLEGGTLADYLKKHPRGLPEPEALFIFRQILEGYVHMRGKQIVHRDLKPDNVLFKIDPERSKKVAIIDFGYCEMQEVPNRPQVFYNVGSPKYMSPEAYKENYYSQKSDIWALGVIFYEMLAGRTCDQGMSMERYLEMIESQGIPLPGHFTPFSRHLLCLMLHNVHNNRFNGEQLLRQIDLYQYNLNHQKSEVILRGSFEEGDLRSSVEIPTVKMNKNSSVFQSLILPTSNEGMRSTQGMFLKPGSRAPLVRINPRQSDYREKSGDMVSQESIKNQENTELTSVRDIIHRRPLLNPGSTTNNHLINPFGTQIYPRPPEQNLSMNQTFQFQSQGPQQASFANLQQQKPSFQNGPQVIPFSNQTNKIQFVHPFPNQFPPQQVRNEPQQFPPRSNGIKIRINNPGIGPNVNPNMPIIQHIQQEKRIEFQPTERQCFSPEKQHITLASNVQFFSDKKPNLIEATNQSRQPRQVINLRPPFNNAQIKIGFTKLQPQRLFKNFTHQNELPIQQGFCV